jgi:hypothetical protein
MVVPENASDRQGVFPNEFDDTFSVGPKPGNSAFFGLSILQGLVDGIDDFIHESQPRWSRRRSLGPALLGSSMWINDEQLIRKVGELSAACIVVSKQGRAAAKLEPLAKVNEQTPGMPVEAFLALTELAPKEDGKPMVVGPYSAPCNGAVPTIRTTRLPHWR